MIKLKETFTGTGGQKGWEFTQLYRNDVAAIYKKHHEEFNLTYYEVFKIRVKKEKEVFGKLIPLHEHYPGNQDFGEFAWCCNCVHKATTKFCELTGVTEEEMYYSENYH